MNQSHYDNDFDEKLRKEYNGFKPLEDLEL